MTPANLLIVDDIAENLRLLSGILKDAGHHIRPVTNGTLALQAARHQPPDLVLLDIKMPGMDGFEVCRQLKAEEGLRDIPVIFISALQDTEDKLRAFQAGGVDYVTKPFQIEEVQARVHTHLQLRRQRLQLQESYQRLQLLERLRDSLTHMVVHDMRSPLMSIGGYLEMLQLFESGGLTPPGLEYVAKSRANVARLIRMADEMLIVSKLEAGAMSLSRSTFDFAALLRETAASVEGVAEPRRIRVDLSVPGGKVSGDRELVGRVLQNLLNNALKFSPAGSPVQVNLQSLQRALLVQVTDQGPGIPVGSEAAIFQKFGQLDRTSKRSGTGLGLAFCKLVVEAHGGQIGVESPPPPAAGSRFWFSLPF
jgi:signal transduction histidine kinase